MHGFLGRDISRDRDRPPTGQPACGDDPVGLVGPLAKANYDVPTSLGERQCGRGSDPSTATGHDTDLRHASHCGGKPAVRRTAGWSDRS